MLLRSKNFIDSNNIILVWSCCCWKYSRVFFVQKICWER